MSDLKIKSLAPSLDPWNSLNTIISNIYPLLIPSALVLSLIISIVLFFPVYIIRRSTSPSTTEGIDQKPIDATGMQGRPSYRRQSTTGDKFLQITESAIQKMTTGLDGRPHRRHHQLQTSDANMERQSSPTVSEDSSETEMETSSVGGSKESTPLSSCLRASTSDLPLSAEFQSDEKHQDVVHLHTAINQASCTKRGKIFVSPSANETKSRTVQGHEIYYEVHGDGPRRGVLIMGLGNSSLSYSSTITHFTTPSPTLSPADYSICVLDNRGVGHSDCPRGPYTTRGMAEDVKALLEWLGWLDDDDDDSKADGKVDVVGISLGGMIAMELATMIPSHVSSLTLGVTTPGYGVMRNLPPWAGLSTTVKLMAVKDRRRRMKYIIDMCFPQRWLNERADESGPGVVRVSGQTNEDVIFELFEFRIANVQPQTMMGNLSQSAAALTHYVSPDRLKILNSVIPKICILTGDEDTLVNPNNSTYMHSIMPKSELITWANTGHGINVQRPALFNALLERVWTEGRSLTV